MNNTQLALMTEAEVSQLLCVSKAALRRWRREGRGPRFGKLERCVRYLVSDLRQFVEERLGSKEKAADSRSAAKREVRSDRATTQT